MSFKTFVITLRARKDRIDNMIEFYNDAPTDIKFFYGLPKDKIISLKDKISTSLCNRFCTTAMVGCASSHILLWNHISETFNDNDIIIIIEDDTFIDIKELNKLYNDIKELYNNYDNNLFLQLTGEGFLQKEKLIFKNLTLSSFKFHVFLGAYMISGKVAKAFSQYYNEKKIDYHIDLSLNRAIRELEIKPMILENKIGIQKGMTNSNMSFKNRNMILFNPERAEHLFYTLNFPIIKIFDLVISFSVLFFLTLIVLFFCFKIPFLFLIIGIVIPEVLNFD